MFYAGASKLRKSPEIPDFIHTQKRHPRTNLRSATAMWDFWSLSPESLHQVTILMSDRGLPLSPRFMNGYGSHTYGFWNERGERYWVKFHFRTQQGHRFLTNDEAAKVVGVSRESFGEDLQSAIERAEFPRWTMQVQIYSSSNPTYSNWPLRSTCKTTGAPLFNPSRTPRNAATVEVGWLLMA